MAATAAAAATVGSWLSGQQLMLMLMLALDRERRWRPFTVCAIKNALFGLSILKQLFGISGQL